MDKHLPSMVSAMDGSCRNGGYLGDCRTRRKRRRRKSGTDAQVERRKSDKACAGDRSGTAASLACEGAYTKQGDGRSEKMRTPDGFWMGQGVGVPRDGCPDSHKPLTTLHPVAGIWMHGLVRVLGTALDGKNHRDTAIQTALERPKFFSPLTNSYFLVPEFIYTSPYS